MENNLMRKEKIEYMINKMEDLMQENKITSDKWAKKIGEQLLEQDLTSEQRMDILINLFNVSVKMKKSEDVEKFAKEIMKYDILENMNQSIKVKLREEKFFKTYRDYVEESKYSRKDLYDGKIKLEDLKDLTEENSKTLKGCIFIAETCKYFDLSQLGMKCLKGFKRDNPNLKIEDQNAIKQAMKILSVKKRKISRGEEWDGIYRMLDKITALEDIDDVYTH